MVTFPVPFPLRVTYGVIYFFTECEKLKVRKIMGKELFKMPCCLVCLLLGLLFVPAWLQARTPGEPVAYRDSLRALIFGTGYAEFSCYLSYPIGGCRVDSLFGNNASELSSLRRFLRYALVDTLVCVREIKITGYCSVDDTRHVNDVLAFNRATRFSRFLDARYGIEEKYAVDVQGVGRDWTGLRRLIASSSYRWKEEALRIIDGGGSAEWKKIQIASLGRGDAHRRLYEEFYPRLRRVEIRIGYDVQCMKQKLHPDHKPVFDAPGVPPLRLKTLYRPLPAKKGVRKKVRPVLAVKTNLLFDAALMPNIEVEVPLGRRWSLNGEAMLPWWLSDDNKYCMQLVSGGLEGRYWFGNRLRRRPLTGHFAGVFGGGGKYDFQWKERGYRGEYFFLAGLSYGYSLSLSRRLNMEFSLGVGVLRTSYRHYRAQEDYRTLLWQKDGTYTWFGPTKAKISLVWLLGNKKGGKR